MKIAYWLTWKLDPLLKCIVLTSQKIKTYHRASPFPPTLIWLTRLIPPQPNSQPHTKKNIVADVVVAVILVFARLRYRALCGPDINHSEHKISKLLACKYELPPERITHHFVDLSKFSTEISESESRQPAASCATAKCHPKRHPRRRRRRRQRFSTSSFPSKPKHAGSSCSSKKENVNN